MKTEIGKVIYFNRQSLLSSLRLRRIKKSASKHAKATGLTHYIIPSGRNGHLMIINNRWRKAFNKKKKTKKMSYKKLIESALFVTQKYDRVID